MSGKLQAIRGMNDILPDATPLWQWVERSIASILDAYGYREIRLPIVEQTELFARSIGEVTDIVEKEMYTFPDRNGDSLTLRPEGTAGCVRAAEQHGLLFRQAQRLWYAGPMFRHERPQKGRYRQFHQVGVEAFGMQGPDIDAEVILMSARFWRALGLEGHVRLELNSLGSSEARTRYREELVAWLRAREERLDADSRRRLDSNPLRILDSKDPGTREVLDEAPSLLDCLDAESAAHFSELQAILADSGLEFTLNPRLVRGLDYYGRTVFEWVTDDLGAQGTVCAGGRYDGLVEHLGGKATPAVGFALGLERLLLLLEVTGAARNAQLPETDVYLVAAGEGASSAKIRLAERLRSEVAGIRVECNCEGTGFRSQMKKADRSGARYALILGEDEVRNGEVGVKDLREAGSQVTVPDAEIAGWMARHLGSDARG